MINPSRRFWFSAILFALFFVLVLVKFFVLQIANPPPYRLEGCEIERAAGKETGK
jgi:hypothetical protein